MLLPRPQRGVPSADLPLTASMRVREAELKAFLIRAKRRTYAGQGRRDPSLRPYSKNYSYKDGAFRYEDQYFGEYIDVGEELVWYHGIPLWGMGYRGGIHRKHLARHREALAFLRRALRRPDPVLPVRGPRYLRRGAYIYTNAVQGDIRAFTGREDIYWCDEPICFRDYVGGIIWGKRAPDLQVADEEN